METPNIYRESERNWVMFTHLSAFAGYIFPFGGIIGPLIFWLARKDESEWVDRNGKASLNFQLSIFLYTLLCIPLVFLVVGVFFIAMLYILEFVCVIIASVKAAQGQEYRYPLCIPFIQ
jgi:uncharacterized Tic20 family protein